MLTSAALTGRSPKMVVRIFSGLQEDMSYRDSSVPRKETEGSRTQIMVNIPCI